MSNQLELIIQHVARKHSLAADLVRAIVQTESGGVATRWRTEPAYRYLWAYGTGKPYRHLTHAETASERAPDDFPHPDFSSRDTEWWGQQASWGPMQIMGAVAREYGFKGDLPALCDPLQGIEMGCTHLAHLADHYCVRYGWAGVVAAYNAGSPRRDSAGQWVNQSYVDTVAKNGGRAMMYVSTDKQDANKP